MDALTVAGYVEVEAGLFSPGVLEDAFRRFLEGPAPVVYCARTDAVLGEVTDISGRGERVEMTAALERPASNPRLAGAYRQIASGTIKALAINGVFSRDRAEVQAFSVCPLTPVLDTGFLTSVTPEASSP